MEVPTYNRHQYTNGIKEKNTYTTELLPEEQVSRAAPVSGATKLKKLLSDSDELIVCPGVYDGFSARIALAVGFSALYMVHIRLTFYLKQMSDNKA